jgi:hypothetical protein
MTAEPTAPEPGKADPATPEGSAPASPTAPGATSGVADRAPDRAREGRPILERIGLAAIALVLAALFGTVAAAAIAGGELFLGIMGAAGCLMTIWVGAMTLIRG